jgi:hypothetical protein
MLAASSGLILHELAKLANIFAFHPTTHKQAS